MVSLIVMVHFLKIDQSQVKIRHIRVGCATNG